MSEELKGRVALITGAGAGNGRAIAEGFAKAGAKVVCVDNDLAGVEETVGLIDRAPTNALALGADITSETDCEQAVLAAKSAFGDIDILVNNAGILVRGGLGQLSLEDWNRQVTVNVTGQFLMSKAAVPRMRDGGNIVMMASVAGLRASPGYFAYSASKHAIIGMTKTLAVELASRRIRVNAICPGLVETGMIAGHAATLADRTKAYPLGRIGQPGDIAGVALHLASDAADWVTGLIYVADGGTTLGTAR